MEIARKMYPFVAALFVLLVAAPPTVEAQGGGLTCGWCKEMGPVEAIASPRDDFSVEYLPEAGRIDFVLACAPSIPAGTIPVPPGIRPALDRALQEPVAVAVLKAGQ